MEELKYSYVQELIPRDVKEYYQTGRSLYEAIVGVYVSHPNEKAYVKKGDLLFTMRLNVTPTQYRRLFVPSPYEGYIEYRHDVSLSDFMNSTFACFYKNEYEIDIKYQDIIIDKIANTKRIIWKSGSSITMNQDRFKCNIEFNIKSNSPCLHFRYQGFNLGVNDKVFFIDADDNPITDFVVVKREHKYSRNEKEVDFIMLDSDIEILKQSKLAGIVVTFANEDAPIKIKPKFDKKEKEDQFYGAFQFYLTTYCEILKQANISYKKKTVQEPFLIDYDYCYVYLMHDKRNGYHKIGISKEPNYRERTLQSEQPNIEMVCSKRFPTRKIAEAFEFALHKAYADKRLRGEWFDLSYIDVIMLKESLS